MLVAVQLPPTRKFAESAPASLRSTGNASGLKPISFRAALAAPFGFALGRRMSYLSTKRSELAKHRRQLRDVHRFVRKAERTVVDHLARSMQKCG